MMQIAATIVLVLDLLSAIITIIVGWEDFLVIVHNWLGLTEPPAKLVIYLIRAKPWNTSRALPGA